MASVHESKERSDCRHALRDLERRVLDLNTIHFGPGELKDTQIRAVKVPLDEDEPPTFKPCFFNPYPAKLLPDPDMFINDSDDFYGSFPEYDKEVPFPELTTTVGCAEEASRYIARYTSKCKLFLRKRGQLDKNPLGPWRYRDQIDYMFMKPLDEFPMKRPSDEDFHWYATDVSYVSDWECSHMKASMVYNIDGDERLLRGELLTLIRIMEGRLSLKSLAEHVLVPVLLFSFMGPQHGRILQGHFDGKRLVVYHSELYDFRHEKNAPVKLFAMWSLCNPIGDTKSLPQQ